MTPGDAKKKKRARLLRVLIPVLLAGLFASLAILENNGVFAAVGKAAAPAQEKRPAPAPVPFTRLSVLNRLETDGFSEYDGLLMRNDAEAGTLALTGADGALTEACCTIILLPEDVIPAGDAGAEMRAQAALDRENAGLIFHAMLEAALGGEEPTEKQLQQGESKLAGVLSAKGEKADSFTVSGCTVTFEKTFEDGLFLLRIRAQRA